MTVMQMRKKEMAQKMDSKLYKNAKLWKGPSEGLKEGNNVIKIMHQNIQSLNSNNLNLVSYIEGRNFDIDIIVLTEVWNTNVNTYRYLLENYKFVNKESKNRAGGIVMYIKENVNWKEIKYEKKTENYDILIISFKNNYKKGNYHNNGSL